MRAQDHAPITASDRRAAIESFEWQPRHPACAGLLLMRAQVGRDQNTHTPAGDSNVLGPTICRVGTTLPLALTRGATRKMTPVLRISMVLTTGVVELERTVAVLVVIGTSSPT